MPSSIPYDPSLTLASVVSEAAILNVEEISKLQSPINAAQDSLNFLIASKRSLEMTKTELKNLGVDATSLDAELLKLGDAIGKAAAEYATANMAAEPGIQKLRESIRMVYSSVDSPVDLLKTEIKTMPLAADTMNMDVQYFSFDADSQNANTFGAQIASYVTKSVGSILTPSESIKLGNAASKQVSQQLSSHKIDGTLILSVTCTHKNATVLAPFVLHVDKAIKVWNHLFPSKKLDSTNKATMMKIAMNESQEDKEKFSIISGTTFGSGFVGMVHILNTTKTSVGDTLVAASQSLQATMDSGTWFARSEGKVGVDSRFVEDVKNLLSQQDISSHVTLLCMGVIPSMFANGVSFDKSTLESIAEASRTEEQTAALQSKAIKSSLGTLAVIDEKENKVLDVDSMMKALDDYLRKASEGYCGIPISYYLKDIDQKMLAEMWVAKYFPGQFISIEYDDSEGAPPEESDRAKL